jgi:hypothetical protein
LLARIEMNKLRYLVISDVRIADLNWKAGV